MSQSAEMPAAASFILTHRLPCALLMVLMLMAALWLPTLLQGVPLLAVLATMIGLALHLLSPVLVALITFGGGASFALQVAAIASLGITALAGFALLPGLAVFLLYGLLPMLAASFVMRQDGIRLSAQYISVGIGVILMAGIVTGAMLQDLGLREYISTLLAPVFDGAREQMPVSEVGALQMLEEARLMTVAILPGIMAIGLWLTWWTDTILARNIAIKYGFYRGDKSHLLGLRFSKPLAYAFLLVLLLANIASGDIQYVAINSALLLAGLLSAQGIAVGHSWLKARGMKLAIGLMYVMLLIWAATIVPFLIIGLLDLWFDFRRNTPATGG